MATLTTAQPLEVKASAPPAGLQRLMSVDALRGFDMFWIIGADSLVAALHRMDSNKATSLLADQLEHADWEGFHFYDLIFPLFVFVMGISVVFSLGKALDQGGRAQAMGRIFRRAILLFLVALFYSGGLSSPWPDLRLMGVLNRIALAYLFGGLLFCFLKPRALVAVCVGLLLGYWALMALVPIRDITLDKESLALRAEAVGDTEAAALFREAEKPSAPNPSAIKDSPVWAAAQRMFYATTNYVTGQYGRGHNLSDHIDFQYLPGRKYDTFFDPEGFLSTLPAIATCLLGIFAGLLLKSPSVPDQQKVLLLLGWGCAGIVVGWLWGHQFPIIKKIWTSSYVLVAGGCSALLLAAFYQVVDVWRVRTWCQPFVWMGMNSITVYMAANLLGSTRNGDYYGFRKLGPRFLGGDVKMFLDAHVAKGAGDLAISIAGLLLAFWFVRVLYKRGVFLRL